MSTSSREFGSLCSAVDLLHSQAMKIERTKTKVMFTADDFGLTEDVNKGIFEVIKHGPVRNVSVMVNADYAQSGADLLLNVSHQIAIGLHLVMTTGNIRDWWHMLGVLVWSKAKIEDEFGRQIQKFEDIFGFSPQFVDGHGLHVHLYHNVEPVVETYARAHSIFLRGKDATTHLDFTGRFYSSTPEKLTRMVQKFPPGAHEIVTHPALSDKGLHVYSRYHHRYPEVVALTDPKLNALLFNDPNTIITNWRGLNK